MGNQSPGALQLQSSPGSWAKFGLDSAFPGHFWSLWEKEPQVAPVNTSVPLEEQPPPRRAPQASRPLLGEAAGSQENICEQEFFQRTKQ